MKKGLVLILFFYILALIQTSFLVHFNIEEQVPNLILIALVLLTFFEKPEEKLSFFGAGIGGFFLDIFSNVFLGTSIIALLLMTFLFKKLLEIIKGLNILWFLIFIFLSLVFYNLFSNLVSFFISQDITAIQISLGKVFIIKSTYNLILGLIAFYIISLLKKYVFARQGF
ncbi:hypothetical protein IH779_03545 [Patescibacteria group bacterium]|nr:hypothetical protein [Patescibacteria group bacterium]